MKQAIHIFLKDLHTLWIQVTTLMLAIGIFALVDITNTNDNPGGAIFSLVVGAAVWFLIARAVHQESLPGENQFWLTRPYERNSLLVSKLLLAVCIVVVPFFVADCVILLAQSLPLAANLGGLVLRQFIVAGWLVLPPFAIATVTRSITEDIMVWLAGIAIAAIAYSPWNFRSYNEKYLIPVALALMLAAIGRQYFTRGTKASRAIVAIAVLLPVLPFPEPAALAIEGLRNDPATSRISLAADSESIAERPRASMYAMHCASLPVSVEGMQSGWRLDLLSQEDTFSAGGKTRSIGWRPTGWSTARFDFEDGSEVISVCLNASGLQDLGASGPLALHTSIVLAVLAEDPPVRIKATLNPFSVPGIGTCQFQVGITFRRNYELACKAPVWFPRQGRVIVGSVDSWSPVISTFPYPWAPMNLLPGMSPVHKWETLPLDTQIREAIANGGEIEFKTATPIAIVRRELTVKDVRFVQD